jgi:biotin carboxyl carrier protein
LVVVVVAAIGFLVYRYAMKSAAKPEPVKPAPAAMKPVPPPPPPVESHKLATTPEQSTDVKPTANGQIETLAKDGPVTSGAVIATFAGAKPLQTEVAGLTKDVDTRLPAEIAQAQKDADAATAANNKNQLATAQAKLAERQKSLADRQTKLTAKQADLDKLEIKAPATGTIASKSKVGAHVTPNDTVFTLTQAAVRTATFAKADGATAGAHVLLVDKASGQKLACTVTSADPGATAISCPADMTPDGADVTYGGIDPSPPPPPVRSDAGSAAVAVPPPAPVPHPPAPHPAATHTQPKAPVHPKAPAAGSSTGSSNDTTTEPVPSQSPSPSPDTGGAGSAQ